jgi:hypothetical protein
MMVTPMAEMMAGGRDQEIGRLGTWLHETEQELNRVGLSSIIITVAGSPLP